MKKHLGKRFLSTLLVVVMVLTMLPMSVFAAGTTYSGTTIDVLDGATTEAELYAAFKAAMGEPSNGGIDTLGQKTYKYGSTKVYNRDEPVAGLTGGTISVTKSTGSSGVLGSNTSYGNATAFTIRVYHNVVVSIAGSEYGTVSYNGKSYNNGDTIKVYTGGFLAITPNEGYEYSVTAGTAQDITASGSVSVSFTAEGATNYNVSSGVVGNGTVTLSPDGEVADGTSIAITATPATATGYVKSVVVKDTEGNVLSTLVTADAVASGAFADRVYTGAYQLNGKAIVVHVEFAERTLTAKNAEVKVNAYYASPYTIPVVKIEGTDWKQDEYGANMTADKFLVSANGDGAKNIVVEMNYTTVDNWSIASKWGTLAEMDLVGKQASLDPPECTKEVRLVWLGDVRYPTVTSNEVVATIKESRTAHPINNAQITVTANEQTDFITAVKDAVVARINNASITVDNIDVAIKNGAAYTGEGSYTVLVKVTNEGATWISHDAAGAAAVEIEVVATVRSYTVTWVIEGVSSTETYKYGETPSYKGAPTKAADANGHYTFASWTPALSNVAGNITYTATFTTGAHVDADDDHDHKCDVCGYADVTGCVGGTPVQENYTAPTCGAAGSYEEVVYCTECGAQISRETKTIDATGNHNYEQSAHQDATCTVDGYTAYTCSVCGDSYTETHTAPGHTSGDVVIENNTGASCSAAGSFDKVTYCTVCTTELSRENVTVPATGEHQYLDLKERVSASCTVDGHEIWACACGEEKTVPLTAPGHTSGEAVVENKVDSTCHAEGSYDSVVYCSVCNTELSREKKTIEKKAHTPALPVVENENPATCTEDGSYENVTYCSVKECRHEIKREPVSVPMLGHGTKGYTYENKNNGTHAVWCVACNTVTETVVHTFGSDHTCICDAVETFAITWVVYNKTYTTTVEFGTVPVAPTNVELPANHSLAGWDKEIVAVSGATTYTATLALNATNGTVYVNGNITELGQLVNGLKEKVLAKAGLISGNYSVVLVGSAGRYDLDNLSWGQDYLAGVALDAALVGNNTVPFEITNTDTGVSKTVYMEVDDSRLVLDVQVEDLTVSAKSEPSDLMNQIMNKVTITATNPETGAVTNVPVIADYISIAGYAWPADGQPGTFTVTVSIAPLGNGTYQAYANKTLTLTCVDTTKLYNITWDINGNKQTVQVAENTLPTAPTATREHYTFNGWDKTIVAATEDTTYTATWKPTNDKNGNNNPDELDTFTILFVNGGPAPLHKVEDLKLGDTVESYVPTAAQTPAGKYFAGWDRQVVAVKAEDADEDSVIVYTAQWNEQCTVTIVYGNGTTDGSELIIPGKTINLTDPSYDQHIFDGWYVNGQKVTMPYTVTDSVTITAKWLVNMDRDEYEDGTENDPYWTVTVDGTTVSETTLNGEYATPDKPADRTNAFFVEWTMVKDDANHTITFTSVWNENDSNDNNVDDSTETITVNAGDGEVKFNNAKVANGDYVFNSNENSNTIVITPPVGCYIASINFVTRAVSGTYSNGVLTISNYALVNGTTLEVTYAKHEILADGDLIVDVNGYTSATIFESLTKEEVLSSILGTHYDASKINEYTVTMKVSLARVGIDRMVDVNIFTIDDDWGLLATGVKEIMKGSFDLNQKEIFTVAWDSSDETRPVVSGDYEVTLNDDRPLASAHWVDGKDGKYVSSDLDKLLDAIKGDLTSDTGITKVEWKEKPEALEGDKTYNLIALVTLNKSEEYQGNTVEIPVSVYVPATKGDIIIPGTAEMIYNTSMGISKLNEMVIVALNGVNGGIDFVPDELANAETTVWYLARSAGTTVPIRIQYTGMSGLINIDETINIPINEDAWLKIGEPFPDVGEAPSQAELEALVDKMIGIYGLELLNMSNEQLLNIFMIEIDNYPEIKKYISYIGYHQFGYNDKVDANGFVVETVKLTQEDAGYGALTSNTAEISLNDERYETYINLAQGVHVTYGFTAAELLEKLASQIYAKTENGDVLVNGAIELVTDIAGMNATDENGVEITVRYPGDENNKFCTATATIVIDKATVDVKVENNVFKWEENLWSKHPWPVTTNPAGVAKIEFVVGLDIADLNVDLSEGASISAIKGIVGKVQLLLPQDLQDLLVMAGDALNAAAGTNLSFADGATMKLSDLKSAVSKMEEVFASYTDNKQYQEYFGVLMNMLNSLPTENADIEVTIGGGMPADMGVYLIGAVSADQNYTTNFGVGVLAISPDGIKAELAWNQNDDNYIITNSLLASGAFDAGAHATSVGAGGTIEGANEQIAEIFLGVDIDGKITIEMDQAKLDVGAYVEVAMTVDWGNTMYYSVPLVRPIVVVAETLDVDFVDASGEVNNDRHFEFFNVPQNGMEGHLKVTYKQNGNGYKAGDEFKGNYSVKYVYAGVQTNGMPYFGEEAPVHAGVYTITAIVVARDGDRITHAGQGIGALVIEPSKSTTTVENETIKWDGEEHKVNQFVDADSVNVPGLTPDTTVISAGIHADLNANIGLDAVKGNVNIDMPSWMDSLLKKLNVLEAGYSEAGITAEVFLSYVEKLESEMVNLGVETDAFAKIVDVIKQLPGKTTLTFHDDKGYDEVGVYLIVGIVTDSDHYPSADAGIMVIYPDATKVELRFDVTWDDNNIFTQEYLKSYELNAQAYELGAPADAKPLVMEHGQIINLFVGFADHGEFEFTSDKTVLDNGVYEQVAFVWDLSNAPYYAEPINREIVILPNNADVDFVDEKGDVNNERHFHFTNKPHAMNAIRVTLVDGTVLNLTAEDGRVAIFYAGVQTNGKPYASYDAPVHAGAYEVTAQFTERDAQGRVINLGIGIGVLVIEPAQSNTAVDNATFPYGESHKVNDLVHTESESALVNQSGYVVDKTVISAGLSADLDTISGLSSINGTVNIDMPVWMDTVLKKLGVLEAGYIAGGISAETFLSYVESVKASLKDLGVDTAAFDEITNVIEQLPITTKLTFADDIAYSEVGVYLVIGIATDFNHYPSVGVGAMAIYPDATKAELEFEEDWNGNNIFTWTALANMNLEAYATVNGVKNDEATSHVYNLYLGYSDNGKFVVEIVKPSEHLKDHPEFGNGAYAQVALLLDIDNTPYYAEPISRAFVILPTPAIIEFVDENGNVNADRHFTFNNKAHAMDVRLTVNGVVLTDLTGLSVNYTGVQTNGEVYNSDKAPVESGAYVVTATYTTLDEQGRLVTLGAAVGAMVIEPAKAEVEVDTLTHEFDNTAVDTKDMIHVIEDAADYAPDTTIITAGINTDGTFRENLLNAINTEINIDLPVWADKILAEIESTQDGTVTVAGVIAAIEKVEAKLAELAAKTDVELESDVFGALKNVLGQMDPTFTVTFNDAPAYKEVGAYLVIGVVTDNNFYPTMDAGVLVIYPNVDKAELNWIYEDTNNVFTLDTLSVIDLGAYVTVNGAKSNDVPFEVLYLGVNTETMEIVLTRDQADLDVGVYTEVAYVLDIGSEMYVAQPIVREVVIVPNTYVVQAEDVTHVYDGVAKEIGEIVVLNQFGNDITANGELTVNYMGITAGIDGYMSSNAPTEAGMYNVVITFVTYDKTGNITGAGSKVVSLTIKRADPVFDLQDNKVIFNGTENFVNVLNEQNIDYVAVIRTEAGINLIFTDGLSELAAAVKNGEYDLSALKTAIENGVALVKDLDLNSEFVEKLLATIEEANNSVIYKVSVNGTNPIEAGTYKAYAITVPTANYRADVSEGTLVIEPAKVTITVNVADDTIYVCETPDAKLTITVTAPGVIDNSELNAQIVYKNAAGEVVTTFEKGEYTITAIYAESNNYVVTVVDAVLTVDGHAEEIIPGKDATCTATGLTEGKKCSVCGEILVEQETISATGHSDNDPADHRCDTCGETVSECADNDGDHKCDICGKDLPGETPAPTGVTVSGKVTTYNDLPMSVTVYLMDGETEAASTTTDANGNYSFENVSAGTYTIKVSKDTYVTREVTVVVADTNVTQDMKIYLKGDVNMDGVVDIGDHQRLFEHLQEIAVITDADQLAIANVNEDDIIDIGDHQRLFEHLQEIAPLV